jgi:hypothetical protein
MWGVHGICMGLSKVHTSAAPVTAHGLGSHHLLIAEPFQALELKLVMTGSGGV